MVQALLMNPASRGSHVCKCHVSAIYVVAMFSRTDPTCGTGMRAEVKSVHTLLRNARCGLLLAVWPEAAVGAAVIVLVATACATAKLRHKARDDKEAGLLHRLACASVAS